MRRLSCLAGVALLLWSIAACDTEQPAGVGEQTLEIDIRSDGALVNVFDVWDVFRDQDMDGQPDDTNGDGQPDIFLYCQQAQTPPPNPTPITRTVTNAPWPFSIEISVLRDGETQPNVLTSDNALNTVNNLTPYDPTVLPGAPACPRQPAVPCPDPNGVFFHTNPRRLTQANRAVLDTSGLQGSCPGAAQGDPGLDGAPGPFRIQVNKGDTVIVKARRPDMPPGGFPVLAEPALVGSMTLGGRTVLPSGTTASAKSPSAGISFFFTVR